MKITKIPTAELLRMLRATEQAVGPNSDAAIAIRRELDRRRQIEKGGSDEQ